MKNRFFFRALVIAGLSIFLRASATVAENDWEPDVMPVPVKTPPPVYPLEMRRLGISGLVSLLILVDEQGNVVSCSVHQSTRPEFIRPTVQAVKRWKFRPAMKDGNPVKYQFLFPINFSAE